MKFRLFLSCLCLATKVYSQCNASVYLYVCIVLELPFLINSQYHTKYTHTPFRLGSAIVADQVKSIPFLAKLPNNPLCFLIYSKGSRLPQDQEVRILTSRITSIVTANHNHESLLMIFIASLLRYPSPSSTTLHKWDQPCTSSTWNSAPSLALRSPRLHWKVYSDQTSFTIGT